MKKYLRIKNFLSGTLLVLATTGSAHAALLATWGTDGFNSDNQVSFEAAGITGSDLYTSGGGTSGYTPGVYNWDIWGSTEASNATFGLDMTTDSNRAVDQFNFNMFNNDCQTDGTYFPSWCDMVQFGVRYSINGGAFSSSLLNFRVTDPYSYTDYTVDLNLNLNAGDILSMQIFGIDDGSDWPGTGQYVITDISLNGSVPEPSILALFGAGFIGFGLARRRLKK